MHESVRKILVENSIPTEPDPIPDVDRLSEAFHAGGGEGYLRGVNGFRLFVHEPPDVGRRFPADSFYRLILGLGKKGFETLVSAYMATRSDAPEALGAVRNEVATLLAIPRKAKALGLIAWDSNDYNPLAESKERLTVRLPAELRERVTVAAFEAKTTLSAFVESALTEALAKIEKRTGRPISPRGEER